MSMNTTPQGAFPDWHGTTIIAVRKNGRTVIAGDGQVSMGPTIVKGAARKVRVLAGGKVLAGFAGATADAFTLIERLEAKLEQYPDQLARACVDLAKDWRTDRYLRRLEAMLLVADASSIFTVTGVGDVLEPEHGVAAVGSGGNFALAAARALSDHTDMDAEQIARKAMAIAADICVYTNGNLTVETLDYPFSRWEKGVPRTGAREREGSCAGDEGRVSRGQRRTLTLRAKERSASHPAARIPLPSGEGAYVPGWIYGMRAKNARSSPRGSFAMRLATSNSMVSRFSRP